MALSKRVQRLFPTLRAAQRAGEQHVLGQRSMHMVGRAHHAVVFTRSGPNLHKLFTGVCYSVLDGEREENSRRYPTKGALL